MPSYPYDEDKHPQLFEASEQGRKAAEQGLDIDDIDLDEYDQDEILALHQGYAHHTLTTDSK